MKFLETVAATLGELRAELSQLRSRGAELRRAMDDTKMLAAEPSVQRIRSLPSIGRLRDAELKVFSQFGDDGIIQYLVHHLPIAVDTFVEFGVSDYREATTRHLLMRDNWRGLVLDASSSAVEAIRRDEISWRHDLRARSAFVTRETINDLIRAEGFSGRIGLLHIDIDGNDYWVWQAIDVVAADIVIVEYNAVFGAKRAVTIPYDAAFERQRAHPSHLYWGASLAALARLGAQKGYRFVGCNSAGNNAYFVREEMAAVLPRCDVASGFVESRFRESRDEDGKLTFLSGAARRAAIGDMRVFDVERDEEVPVRELE